MQNQTSQYIQGVLPHFLQEITYISIYHYIILLQQMPRQQNLDKIVPNKFYQLSAVLKYINQGQNSLSGIIQQNQTQAKICIPKNDVQLQVGKQYKFTKCFNSKNGWLYVKDPNQSIKQKQQSDSFTKIKNLSLGQIFSNRQNLQNYYLSTDLMVIGFQKLQDNQKNNQNLNHYKIRCFGDELIIQINTWDKQLNQQQVKGHILRFNGFKLKLLTHNSITLLSTVYSSIQPSSLKFKYDPNILYRNVSSVFQVRNIQEVLSCCKQIHKNYSILKAKIQQLQELCYQGCSNCKKKLIESQNGCYQCGKNISIQKYNYLKIVIKDEKDILQAAVFNQKLIQALKQQKTDIMEKQIGFIFRIKSVAKRNHNTGQMFISHVIVSAQKIVNDV